MKRFEVVLTKSYIVTIKAENESKANQYAEFFTGNIQDISSAEHRNKFLFKIEDIDCKMNQSFEAIEIL